MSYNYILQDILKQDNPDNDVDIEIPNICKRIIKYTYRPNFINKTFNATGQQIGLLIAYRINNNIFIGHSMCNSLDIYDRNKAYEIATKRAQSKFNKIFYSINISAADEFGKFLSRVARYFKYGKSEYNFPKWFEYWINTHEQHS